jgi:ribonuclease D
VDRPGDIALHRELQPGDNPALYGPRDSQRAASMPEHATHLISARSELETLVEHIRAEGRFAFDTEFVSEETYEPVLCLAQVATRERIAAIDTLAIGSIGPLWDVLTDPAIEVVMHAAGEDLRICLQRAGRLPPRVVDVQLAAALVGHGYPLSLGNLVRAELGVNVSGGETRTDWRRRPLSPAQLRYALDDVRYLLDVADRIGGRMSEWGRSAWAEAEYRSLVETIADRHEDEDRWRRISGLGTLSRRGLEAARRLDAWRRREARQADRPFRHILRDDLLVAIAKRQPGTRKDLEALRDFQRSHLLARSREILDLIAEARAMPDEALPAHGPRNEDGPGLSMVVSLLNATLGQCCAGMRLAAPLVGTSGDLRDLVRWHAAGRPEVNRPRLADGWRGEACGPILLDVLSGRRALRIVDPTADLPVAVEPLDPDIRE